MQNIELFLCVRREMKLTTGGCKRLFLSAKEHKPQEFEGRHACLACPIGAANAGEEVPVMQEAVTEIRRGCPRCTRLSPRLINDRFCISCYNRQAEAIKGKNARGGRPKLSDDIHDNFVSVIHGSQITIRKEANVISMVETILVISHHAKEAMAFGPAPVTSWPDAHA